MVRFTQTCVISRLTAIAVLLGCSLPATPAVSAETTFVRGLAEASYEGYLKEYGDAGIFTPIGPPSDPAETAVSPRGQLMYANDRELPVRTLQGGELTMQFTLADLLWAITLAAISLSLFGAWASPSLRFY